MNQHLYYIVKQLVSKNDIRIHEDELQLQLLSHPSYPSLHSVTGVLDHFSIPNAALRIPKTQEVLQQLPPYFMASMTAQKGQELVLVEKKSKGFKTTNDAKDKRFLTSEEFLVKWDGIVLAIEKDETISKPANSNSKLIRNAFFALLLLAGVTLFFSLPTLYTKIHFTLSSIGLALSILITQHELGFSTTNTHSFCTISEKASCDAVLESKGAKLFGFIKMSDLSFVVFTGFLSAWIFAAVSQISIISAITFFAWVAVPFVGYSVYYQYAVVKKWCPLCMGIVCILLCQFGFLFIGGTTVSPILFTTPAIAITLGSFLIITVIWGLLKPILLKKKALDKLEIEHHSFKRNFSLFNTLHREGEALSDTLTIPGEVILGNPHAPVSLILITSPFCFYCKEAHRDIESILHQGKNNVRVTLRFMVDTDDKSSHMYKVISEVTHIYNTRGQAATIEVLKTLYAENSDIVQWIEQQNIHYNPGYDYVMQQQMEWCKDNGINFTPALYLYNRPFPKEYSKKDLLYFIDDFIEQRSPNVTTSVDNRVAS